VRAGQTAPDPSSGPGLPLSAGIPLGLIILMIGGLLYLRSGRRPGWLVLAGLGLLMTLGSLSVIVLAARSMP